MLDSNIESTEPYIVPETLDELAGHYKEVLRLLGEDTEREGLLKTPLRVAKAMQFLTNFSQAINVLPLPANGSRTRSPGFDDAETILSISFNGF